MPLHYIYNKSTGTLHIEGFCYHGKVGVANGVRFNTEAEAYAYAGQQIKPCKTCQNKKEQMLREAAK